MYTVKNIITLLSLSRAPIVGCLMPSDKCFMHIQDGWLAWLVYGVECHFQQYFSFIGGGNWNTWIKQLICHKSLTLSHNVVSSTPCHEQDSNS